MNRFNDQIMALWSKFCSSILIILPLCSWTFFFCFLFDSERKYKKHKLQQQRHNCVVMYSKKRGMIGWPTDNKLDLNVTRHVSLHFKPILYFISTAHTSLDIAVMMITINTIGKSLIDAQQKGVKVRIIVDFLAARGSSLIRELEKSGIQVNYYIPPISETESIMHYKYIVKDYFDGSGYACTGSMNWTITGLFNNYEDIVFSSNDSFVKALNDNFVETWNFIELSKQAPDVKAKFNLLAK